MFDCIIPNFFLSFLYHFPLKNFLAFLIPILNSICILQLKPIHNKLASTTRYCGIFRYAFIHDVLVKQNNLLRSGEICQLLESH